MMHQSKSFVRSIATFGILAATAIFATPTFAQTSYNWLGTGADLQAWETAGNWEDTTTPSNPAAFPPGSLLNSATPPGPIDDVVTITNQLSSGTNAETVRINNVNVGQIGNLIIGGNGIGAGTGDEARVQVRGNGGNITIGTLTLGAGSVDADSDDNPGQFLVNNQGSSATVGSVVSGSTDTANRIQVGNNANGALTLSGNIDSSGRREIDLIYQSDNPARFILSTGNQLLSVDEFRVGSSFNGNNVATYTLDNGNDVEANLVRIGFAGGNQGNPIGTNTNPSNSTGALTVTGGSLSAIGTSGENGVIRISSAEMNKPAGGAALGTLNVGANGIVRSSGVIDVGYSGNNPDQDSATASSTGNLNLNDASAIVNAGRIDNSGVLAGGITVGQNRNSVGTVTVSDGTLNSLGRIYLGGDSNQGGDRDTTGNLIVNGGIVNVGADPNFTANGGTKGASAEVDYTGSPRDISVDLGNANVEVGRDGRGFMTVNDGTVNLWRGNLVLGQSATEGANNYIDTTGNGNGDSRLNGTAGLEIRDERNAQLIDFSPAGLNVDYEADPGNPGEFILTAAGLAKMQPNTSRGTYLQTGGVVNVGSTQGADPDGTPENVNDINYNNGGGDVTISGGALNVEQNVNMGANDPGQAVNTLTVSGTGSLNVGQEVAGVMGGIDSADLNGQDSDIFIVGGGVDINIATT